MIIRALFTKKNYLRYLSHLDLVRLFQRCLNRCNIPIKYTEGFNPHPKYSIANPLSLGIESEGEYIDVELIENMDIDEFITRMNSVLPKDIQIIKAAKIKKDDSLSSLIKWAHYEIKCKVLEEIDLENISQKIDEWLKRDEILIKRLRKRRKRKVEVEENIKPLIGNVVVKDKEENNFIRINALLKATEGGTLRPMDFIQAMDRDLELKIDLDLVYLKRLELLADDGERIYRPL